METLDNAAKKPSDSEILISGTLAVILPETAEIQNLHCIVQDENIIGYKVITQTQ